MKICVCMGYWGEAGGAESGWRRLFKALPQYEWVEITKAEPCDVLIYSNNAEYYTQAKKVGIKHIIQRTTGIRSYGLPQPDDLAAIICSSKKAYDLSKHSKKQLIYNGVDLNYLKSLEPIQCDMLAASARVGVGQKIDVAIKYAKKHNRHLTVLGGKQHLHEDTYNQLRNANKDVMWTGVVSMEEAARYIAGCNALLHTNKSHGCSNAVIESMVFDKEIINISGAELEKPPIEEIDIKIMSSKYQKLLSSL
jgi:histidyl-tRNA synthetase